MSGLDGAMLDEYTQGINAPGNGQQGYVAFVDSQAPRPNLTYKSPTEAAAALKSAIAQTVDAKSAEPSTIAANGSHQVTLPVPVVAYGVFEYMLRAQVRIGTNLQWYSRRKFTVTTSSVGQTAVSHDISEAVIGSGFTLSGSIGPNSVILNVASSTGTPGTVFASITELYSKVTPTP